MMCSAEVTGSLVPTVAKQIQSVEPETNKWMNFNRNQQKRAAPWWTTSWPGHRISYNIYVTFTYMLVSFKWYTGLQNWKGCWRASNNTNKQQCSRVLSRYSKGYSNMWGLHSVFPQSHFTTAITLLDQQAYYRLHQGVFHSRCSVRFWPAGIIPMWSEQGSRVSSGQFGSIPLSICVLQISPWMISLNMPSPPTQTTLSQAKIIHKRFYFEISNV